MATRQRTSSIAAIFFDLDNTLILTRKADKLACNKLAEVLWEKYAVPADRATVACSNFLRAFRKCPDNAPMDLDTWRHLLWTQALGDQYNRLAGDVYLQWLHFRYHYLALIPETKLLLSTLRQHYLLGLITNGPSNAQWEKIHRLDLQSHFDVLLVSGDLPWEKPNHKIFFEACRFLGVEPHQCIMVGDKLETDILGGIQAKLGGTVWLPLSSADLDSNGPIPDYIIKNLIDLPDLLPNNPKVPAFRRKGGMKLVVPLPDIFDCNSNSSDGS